MAAPTPCHWSLRDLQRFAARRADHRSFDPHDPNSVNTRLFTTPRMVMYMEQANKFIRDPTFPVPSVDDDVMKEVLADLIDITSREVERLSMED